MAVDQVAPGVLGIGPPVRASSWIGCRRRACSLAARSDPEEGREAYVGTHGGEFVERETRMNQAWAPVITVAIIVIGVVGGRIAHTLIKRVIPLLETLVKERQKGLSSSDAAALKEEIASLRTELGELRAGHQRLDGVEERVEFLQSLLEKRPGSGQIGPGDIAGAGKVDPS
jgi:hypothetical protein